MELYICDFSDKIIVNTYIVITYCVCAYISRYICMASNMLASLRIVNYVNKHITTYKHTYTKLHSYIAMHYS